MVMVLLAAAPFLEIMLSTVSNMLSTLRILSSRFSQYLSCPATDQQAITLESWAMARIFLKFDVVR